MTETPERWDGPEPGEIVPVTLVTGFLGSGKSTLLGEVLRDPRFANSAVVVNEFGEVGLDDFLVEHSEEQLVEMTTGCLCCTIRGDIRDTLVGLHDRRKAGEIRRFDRLIVETTGLADPAPVIHTLMADPKIAVRYSLGGVVTVVDAVNGRDTIARQDECVRQVAVADRLVLSKTDLPAAAEGLDDLQAELRRLNPGATVLDRNAAGFDVAAVFDTPVYDIFSKSLDVQSWINAEAFAEDDGHHGHHGHHEHHGHHGHHDHHHHDDHHHDVNRHGDDILSWCLVMDEPIPMMAFMTALELLIGNQGQDLLRVKGIVHLAEKPDTPMVVHGVQHVFHNPVWLEKWPSDDRRTRIVFITRNIRKEGVERFFAAWQRATEQSAVDLPAM
mgnify:CR=1 FL=1